MPLYDNISDLAFSVEQVSTSQRELPLSWFTRVTTEIVLSGGGASGRGEDVNYLTDVQKEIPGQVAARAFAGEWTIDSWSQMLAGLGIEDPFHRWALESAGLDLALRQSESTLAELLGSPQAPVRFCLSMSLDGDPPSTQKVHNWIAADPTAEFKIDAARSWSDDLVRDLHATGAVRVIDIKGYYEGDWIDNTPDPELYARIATLAPDVIIEDAKLLPETIVALGESGMQRLSFDAPIHHVDDVRSLELRPAAINIKPSRFGSLRSLLDTIDYCEGNDIPLYGGGQFELGYGRTQAQHLAALFYASAANDVAPSAYHEAQPGDSVPTSPLVVPDGPGFGFETS